MTTIIMNIIISIINSILDIFLIHFFTKILYSNKNNEISNKYIICIEFLLLTLSNYFKFKYLWVKIFFLFLSIYLPRRKNIKKFDKSLLILIGFIVLKYPVEQLLSYFLEWIFNTRLLNIHMYLAPLKVIILEIFIKYFEYSLLVFTAIHYVNYKKHINHFKLISIFISLGCSIILMFSPKSLFYFPNIGKTFFVYNISLYLCINFIYLLEL